MRAHNRGLHAAVITNQLDLLARLLDAGVEVTKTDAAGRTPLHIATRGGQDKFVAKLLEKHTKDDVDMQDNEGNTPLYYAVAGGYLLIVNLFLQKGADPNKVASMGGTILSLVLHKEDCQEIAEALLRRGASPLITIDTGLLDLICAAASGNKPHILSLLEDGVDVNGQDGFGYNALYEAARFGHYETVELLIDAGAKLNARAGLGGDTALHGIFDKGYRCWERLQEFAYESPIKERTSIPYLADQHYKVVQLLLQHGTMPDAKRWDGLTVSALISRQLNTNERDKFEFAEEDRAMIMKLRALIENPPAVTRKAPLAKWSPSPEKLNDERREVCSYFKVRVHYYNMEQFMPRLPTVDKFIYDRQGEKDKFKELEDWAAAKQNETRKPSWKWIHLPANNVSMISHTKPDPKIGSG